MATSFERLLRKVPLYPLFIGLYPVLALWLANITQIPSFAVVRSLLISLAVSAGVFFLCWLLIRTAVKAGLVSGLIVALFFFYGHIFNLVDNARIGGAIIGRHRFLLPLALILVAAVTVLVLRAKKKTLYSWNTLLNIVGLFLVLLVGAQIFLHQLRSPVQAQTAGPAAQPITSPPANSSPGRDVYYILIDTYARQDILANPLGIDNSQFVRQLQDLGFIVNSCAPGQLRQHRFLADLLAQHELSGCAGRAQPPGRG